MRNLSLLFIVQASLGTVSGIFVASGSFLAFDLTGSALLATLPLAAMSIGLSVAALLAPPWARKRGRRAVFLTAALACLFGALVALTAFANGSFWLFNAAATLLGASQGVTNHLRYAALDAGPAERAPLRLGIVVLGGVVASYLGPGLCVSLGSVWQRAPHAGGFIGLAGLSLVGGGALLLIDWDRIGSVKRSPSGVPLAFGQVTKRLFASPAMRAALVAGTFAFVAMSVLMAAAPLAIHQQHAGAHGFEMAAHCVAHHMMSMYAPSLLAGWLLNRFGGRRIMLLGCWAFVSSQAIGYSANGYVAYTASLIGVGVGWNLLYVASSYVLSRAADEEIRPQAQGLHDFVLFSAQIPAQVAAAPLVLALGWQTLCGVFLLLSAGVGAWLYVTAAAPRRATSAATMP